MVQMRALERLCCETHSKDRPLHTGAQATRSLNSPQLSLSHSRNALEFPYSWADLGKLPPKTSLLTHCCSTSLRGSRHYIMLFTTPWRPHHFLGYFDPKWDSSSGIRQLYLCGLSRGELSPIHSGESKISHGFDVLTGFLTHTRNGFSEEINNLMGEKNILWWGFFSKREEWKTENWKSW